PWLLRGGNHAVCNLAAWTNVRRRSLDDDVSGSQAHYRIDAFGERFHLNLTADSSFIAPSYAVQHLGAEPNDTADSHHYYPQDASNMRHCFFRGHVNAKTHFPAVFSLCTGLASGPVVLENNRNMAEQLESVSDAIRDQHPNPGPNTDTNPGRNNTTSTPADTHGARSRRKRFLSYPRYVELMVTADAKMVRHHGRNLEHYILTIMSVAAVYRDPSVGNLINIVIVKLVIIHNEQEGPTVNFNAAQTLHNFCVWQQAQNVPDDSHPSHHDTALLITREDICRAKDKCDTLGLAELGTMCDPFRSCSISEENGLSASFTIAHELGHVFNMPHDDNPKCKEAGVKHQFHVMAPTLNYDTSPWFWSKCSRKYITEFLDTGYGECLLDEPTARKYEMPTLLPGHLYNANKQCELMFGPGSQVCPYMVSGSKLWCTSAEGDHKGCRTQHMPPADGTECGDEMYCRHGICVNRELDLRPVNGEWGPWGPYSVCSRSCGGGTRSTSRDCNKPEPRNGGKFCVGRRMKFRSCNTEPCPRGRKDFREEQCSQFDGKHFNINGLPPAVRWVPKYSGILMKDRCKLFCRVSGTMAYYQLKDRVTDGTPCGTDTFDICVQGLCRQAGCDHVLNSKARNDKCGVCGGDNSSCKTLVGTFNDAEYGYNTVVRIPAGATNIDIKQVSYSGKPEDDNYLVRQKYRIPPLHHKQINNFGYFYSAAMTAEVPGCVHPPVCLYIDGIPPRGLHLTQSFVFPPPLQCSSTCAGGFQRRVVVCQDGDGRSNSYCDERVKPAESKGCDSGPCPLWNFGIWGECTQTCGGGRRTRLVVCQRPSGQRLYDRNCDVLEKPSDMEQCNQHACPGSASWHRRPWKPVR
uniref:ADAM metallopeptidase with thrombospondin type 1 motif 20 n=1 Tax=Gadus morhua TaxID=8049 RepID=A0A8C5FR77_GADMO